MCAVRSSRARLESAMRFNTQMSINCAALPPKDTCDQGILCWMCDARRFLVSPTVIGTTGSKLHLVLSLALLHALVNIEDRSWRGDALSLEVLPANISTRDAAVCTQENVLEGTERSHSTNSVGHERVMSLTIALERVLEFEKVTHGIIFDVGCTCQCELLLQYSKRP